MDRTRAAVRAVLPVLLAALALTACAPIERVLSFNAGAQPVFTGFVLADPGTARSQSCEGYLTSDARLAPPAGVPVPDDASWLAPAPVAGAQVYLGWVERFQDRLTALSAALAAEGRARGLTVTAPLPTSEIAEVAFSGAADVDITIQPLCRDHLAIRYVVRTLALDVTPLRPGCRPSDVLPEAPLSPEAALLPFPEGSTPLRTGTLGDLDVHTSSYAAGGQSPAALVAGLTTAFTGGGYAATPLSVAPGAPVATAGFVGRRSGVLQVMSGCDGQVLVRYLLARHPERDSASKVAGRLCKGRTEPRGVGAVAALPGRLSGGQGTVLEQAVAVGAQVRTLLQRSDSVAAVVVSQRAALSRAGATVFDVPSAAGAVSTAVDVGDPRSVPGLVTVRPFCAGSVALVVVTAQP